MCAFAFSALSLLYLGIMLMGHRTFGDVTAGNILKNYAERDGLAVLGRIATFASILFGFPLAMLGLKDSLSSLLDLPKAYIKPTTLVLLAAITAIAILITDIGLIVGISGALLGASIVYVFPALIYYVARRNEKDKSLEAQHSQVASLEQSAVLLLVPFGIFLGVLGVWMTLKGA